MFSYIWELEKITYSGVGDMGPLERRDRLGLFSSIKKARNKAHKDCGHILKWNGVFSQAIGLSQYRIKIVKVE